MRSGRQPAQGPLSVGLTQPSLLTAVMCNHCRKKVKLDKLRRRGKAPPRKGQGKRASKASKKK